MKTHEILAEEYNMSPITIIRDGEFASAVDTICQSNPLLKLKLLGKDSKYTRKEIIELSTKSPEEIERIIEQIEGTEKASTIVSSESNEYYTPEQYIEAARNVLGHFDLDPASNLTANNIVKADKIYTIEDDGLKYDWVGKVWLNPPYGKLNAEFARKLLEQYQAGTTTSAILLINAHVTDTKWFAPFWNYPICFTNHRIDFYIPQGNKAGSTHGSMFVYFGNDESKFIHNFKQFGPIVRRIDDM